MKKQKEILQGKTKNIHDTHDTHALVALEKLDFLCYTFGRVEISLNEIKKQNQLINAKASSRAETVVPGGMFYF